MAKGREGTFARIIKAARGEFLEYGYEKASMRKIAGKAGITQSAIYRHFRDKEAMFSYFVEPFLERYEDACASDMEAALALAEQQDVEQLWGFSDEKTRERIGFAWQFRDEIKLLVLHANGTKYDKFVDYITRQEVESTILLTEHLREQGTSVKDMQAEDVYLVSKGFFRTMTELFAEDIDKEEAVRRSRVLSEFYNCGLRQMMGL